jgi:hypothetical protein
MPTETDAVEPELDVPPAFDVCDAASANWVIRKVIEARKYAERVEAGAAAEVRRAEREEQFFLARYGAQLERWALEQIEANAKGANPRRSINLPAGTVGFRREGVRLSVMDGTKLRDWRRQHLPSALKLTVMILKTPLAQHIRETSECPQGVEVVVGGQRFYIK